MYSPTFINPPCCQKVGAITNKFFNLRQTEGKYFACSMLKRLQPSASYGGAVKSFSAGKCHLKVYRFVARSKPGFMAQILGGLIASILLAMHCLKHYKENVRMKRVRGLRIKIHQRSPQSQKRLTDSSLPDSVISKSKNGIHTQLHNRTTRMFTKQL